MRLVACTVARLCWYWAEYSLFLHVDFRTQLSSTDYGNFLANESLPISTSTIADKATQIMVDQFNYIRSGAVEPLSKFLDYITCVIRRVIRTVGVFTVYCPL